MRPQIRAEIRAGMSAAPSTPTTSGRASGDRRRASSARARPSPRLPPEPLLLVDGVFHAFAALQRGRLLALVLRASRRAAAFSHWRRRWQLGVWQRHFVCTAGHTGAPAVLEAAIAERSAAIGLEQCAALGRHAARCAAIDETKLGSPSAASSVAELELCDPTLFCTVGGSSSASHYGTAPIDEPRASSATTSVFEDTGRGWSPSAWAPHAGPTGGPPALPIPTATPTLGLPVHEH